MKQAFFTLIAASFILFFFPSPVFADDCSSYYYDSCKNYAGCYWTEADGGQCLPYTPRTEGAGVVSSLFSDPDVDPLKGRYFDLGGLISTLLFYLFPIAGLILFGMLIAGGFTMLTAATDPKKAEAGKARITNAIVGFVIIFAAYWLTQILEIVLGVNIL